jgi:ABC-2 type transport system ATP-binding protein
MASVQGATTDPIVRCDGLAQRYRGASAPSLADVSFTLARGELLAVTGPAGAGKSVLARILAGLEALAIGSVTIEGKLPAEQARITPTFATYLAQQDDAPDALAPSEWLFFLGALRGMSAQDASAAAKDLLDRCSLSGSTRRPIRQLTAGQRQMVRFCAALMGYPHLLILDDPTRALDPAQKAQVWTLIDQMHHQTGIGMVVIARDLDDIARLADRVMFLRQGQMVALDTPAALVARYGGGPRIEITLNPGARLTSDMQRWLRPLGQIAASDGSHITFLPRPDLVSGPQPSAPARAAKRAASRATSGDDAFGESWLLDSPTNLPGSTGRVITDVFSIIGQAQIAECWVLPPTLHDVYRQLEGSSPHA